MLLTEFDYEKDAVINPDMLYSTRPEFQETVVTVFSRELFDKVCLYLLRVGVWCSVYILVDWTLWS